MRECGANLASLRPCREDLRADGDGRASLLVRSWCLVHVTVSFTDPDPGVSSGSYPEW